MENLKKMSIMVGTFTLRTMPAEATGRPIFLGMCEWGSHPVEGKTSQKKNKVERKQAAKGHDVASHRLLKKD